MNQEDLAPLYRMKAYRANGITYLPHYTVPNVYVGPGYPHYSWIYTSEELKRLGAREVTELLWRRKLEHET